MYIIIYIVIVISVLFWCSLFIPSRNLDEVFTYNHRVIMSLRISSHIKAFVVLTRADHLFIHNYIRSPLNIILITILLVLMRLKPTT